MNMCPGMQHDGAWVMPPLPVPQPTLTFLRAEQWSRVPLRSRILQGPEGQSWGRQFFPFGSDENSEWDAALGWSSERRLWLCGTRERLTSLPWSFWEWRLPYGSSWGPWPLSPLWYWERASQGKREEKEMSLESNRTYCYDARGKPGCA